MLFGRGRPPADPAEFGRWGENYSRRYLQRRGWRFIARNVTCRGGEIDLVMADPEESLVFIEVKTRRNEDFGAAETVVTYAKKRRMRCAARFFLSSHDVGERACRFDVVVVIVAGKRRPELRHYPAAFSM